MPGTRKTDQRRASVFNRLLQSASIQQTGLECTYLGTNSRVLSAAPLSKVRNYVRIMMTGLKFLTCIESRKLCGVAEPKWRINRNLLQVPACSRSSSEGKKVFRGKWRSRKVNLSNSKERSSVRESIIGVRGFWCGIKGGSSSTDSRVVFRVVRDHHFSPFFVHGQKDSQDINCPYFLKFFWSD